MQVGDKGFIPYLDHYPLHVEYVGKGPCNYDIDNPHAQYFYRALEPLDLGWRGIDTGDIIDSENQLTENGTAAALKVLEYLQSYATGAKIKQKAYERNMREIMLKFSIVPIDAGAAQ